MSDKRFLFIDTRNIVHSSNMEKVLAPPSSYDTGLTIDGHDVWTMDHLHFSWYYDQKRQKFIGWRNYVDDPNELYIGKLRVYKIESDDGLHWNTIEGPSISETVLYDKDETNPNCRYKCIYHGLAVLKNDTQVEISIDQFAQLKEAQLAGRKVVKGMFSAVSPDGIHWHDHRIIILDSYDKRNLLQDANIAFNTDLNVEKPNYWKPGLPGWSGGDNFPSLIYDKENKRYITFYRTNLDRRSWWSPNPKRRERGTGRSECSTFGEWSEHDLVMHAQTDWQNSIGNGKFDYYQLQAWKSGNIFLGVSSVFHWTEDRVRLELVWSPDTMHWERVCPGQDIVPISTEKGSIDFGGHYAAMSPQEINGEIWMYLGSSDGLHNAESSGRATLTRARFKPERFAGLKAKGKSEGKIITSTFKLTTGKIKINAETTIGEIKISLLDKEGKAYPEFSGKNAVLFNGDHYYEEIKWKNQNQENLLLGTEVALMIESQNANLYSIEID